MDSYEISLHWVEKFFDPWTTAKGTPMFMAPEMILGKVPTYGKDIDMNGEDGKDIYVHKDEWKSITNQRMKYWNTNGLTRMQWESKTGQIHFVHSECKDMIYYIYVQ